MSASRWTVLPPNPQAESALTTTLGLHSLVARMLVNRQVATPEAAAAYLTSHLDDLHDPHLLRDMTSSVTRIRQAIEQQEHILVFGDYDVDGVTSTAVTVSSLRMLGADVSALLPNRLDDGYGPSAKLIHTARERGAQLVITLDCGTTAHKEISTLVEAGIDTIILDHHTVRPDDIPPAHAMINPLHPECSYPHKGLASVGLALKLSQALFVETPARWHAQLDLVALGTIADVVPLIDENRILVKHGLERLGAGHRPGIQSLLDIAGVASGALRPFHVGFVLGPRLNASGRMGSADRALQLLLTNSSTEATALAHEMHAENKARQRVESDVLAEAIREVESTHDLDHTGIIVVGQEGWHIGVVGIVAARLVDRYHRPSLVIGFDDSSGRGSGRSIPGFHLTEALTHCGDLLTSFGGHPMACGLSMQHDQLAQLRTRINTQSAAELTPERRIRERRIDAEVGLATWDEELLGVLTQLEPHGAGNPEPLFLTRQLTVRQAPRRVGRNHIKCFVTDGQRTCEAIGFGMANRAGELAAGARIDAVYTPSLNTWNGVTSIQLTLKDIREAS